MIYFVRLDPDPVFSRMSELDPVPVMKFDLDPKLILLLSNS